MADCTLDCPWLQYAGFISMDGFTRECTAFLGKTEMSVSNPTPDRRTFAADLFEKYSDDVVQLLAQRNRGIDEADLHDAFVMALLQIAAKPEKFDASMDTQMVDFLAGAAQRSLLPILRSRKRRKNREEKKAVLVAAEGSAARSQLEVIADAELAENARKVAETDEERNVLRLWELCKSDEEIATELGMGRTDVKLVRDRLTQRLRRLGHEIRDE
jgi:hypothetical protein